MNPLRHASLYALGALLLAAPHAQAQLELSAPSDFNDVRIVVPRQNNSPLQLTGAVNQFSSVGVTSGSSGPNVLPSAVTPSIPQGSNSSTGETVLLMMARVGNSFASGVPRYYLGDEILPPVVMADNVTDAPAGYWRAKPVRPDEIFTNPDGSHLRLSDVSNTPLLAPSAASGKPLAALGANELESFYYSPHADRVFASQAGTVEILWVSSAPEGAGGGAWKFRRETFNVSGATSGEIRRIYWTEKSFNSPRVNVPGGRVDRVNPVYSESFPRVVVDEFVPVGYVPNQDPNAEPAEEKRTLWFEKVNGSAQLAAYNKEGRIFVEYLGSEVSAGKHQFLGADVVQVVKRASSLVPVTTLLGHRVLPRDAVLDGDTDLVGSPVIDVSAGAQLPKYGTQALADGTLTFYAERENLNPDQVSFYWLEDQDASIHFLEAGETPGLSILWPKYLDHYRFIWPTELAEFAHVTTDPNGSTAATGLQFEPGNQPEIIFQDDGAQTESSFDGTTQRLIVDLSASGDNWNRTLLKFSSGDQIWYQAISSQTEDRVPFVESDGGAPIVSTATVGARIERPSDRYSLAGHIAGGEGYQASAYIDPYASGVSSAETGAIIPVNARPSDDELTVRWFERIDPPSPGFAAFYVPSKVGRYTVSFPDDLGAWSLVQSMAEERNYHSATLLPDGRVLVAGGYSTVNGFLSSAELYDPATGDWRGTEFMNTSSWGHTATLLNSGKVLITSGGGRNRAEVFDPTTESWTTVDPMTRFGNLRSAVRLLDGKVLVVGGQIWDGAAWVATEEAEIFDPSTGTWVRVGDMGSPRENHTTTLLADGRVLVAGGQSNIGVVYDSAEVYDPVTQLWTPTNPMTAQRVRSTATRLNNGMVLLAGGTGADTAELYDPETETWTSTGNLFSGIRHTHRAILMPSGKVLLVGGSGTAPITTELYDPETGLWTLGGASTVARTYHTVTMLGNGQLLAVAGNPNGGANTRSVELLDSVSQIVMASNQGTADLTPAQAAGFIYQINDDGAIGFNPNEEHAVKKGDRFYALRDDLNVVEGTDYTSEPFVLVAYTDPEDGRPAMRPFKVRRETALHRFTYPWTAGTKIQGPMPLPVMQLPEKVGRIANTEVVATPDPAPDATAPAQYDSFTMEDRQGYKWVYRGTHEEGSSGTFGMQWYYPMDADFFVPGDDAQPAVGTALPYLRPLVAGVPQGHAVDGTALTVTYRPAWPENPPSMRVAETLTLPKFGLPDVLNQKSAEVFYQQSIATSGAAQTSVTLHDPTRQKQVSLLGAGLDENPETIRTSVYQGKTYFQGLPPHLQTRFYYDPLASAGGSLIFKGEFFDEIAGEDYLDLNVLSEEDEAALVKLAENEQDEVKGKWAGAINDLKTRLETFIEDPSRQGTYIVSSDQTLTYEVGPRTLAVMPDADTARDSYALTATGQGEGYVTLVFANGEVPSLTPPGDPPVVQIIRVIPELYRGDLKVRLSTNPLDEKVTLRHSGDFAAKPDDYEFEWQWAPPSESGTQPATYSYINETYVGDSNSGATRLWKYLQNPDVPRPSGGAYSTGDWSLERLITIRDSNYDVNSGLPGIVLRSTNGADFTSGIPAQITFSADLGGLDGFVLYVNGAVALVHGNGVTALDDLISGQAYDLRLIRAETLADLPLEGESLVVVAEVDQALHFRVFDAAGEKVVDSGEAQFAGKAAELADLKSRLTGLWATTNLATSDKVTVVSATAAITGVNLDQDATSGLSANGLGKQFRVDESFFIKGENLIEVALYTEADAGIGRSVNLRLEGATKTDEVIAGGSPWTKADGTPTLMNRAIVGGSPTAPLGSPLLVMSDNYFTMRYRPRINIGNILAPGMDQEAVGWSDWARPALVEGWIKRVLAAINPFNQRMKDLYNNAVNTDVSLISQAGGKWEGDIALTLDAVNDAGLIEIYETVLNRGKGISIGSGYDYAPANDALLLAAGYLSDLYTILGDEAFADAANPTISLDDQDTITEVNTSRFSFEGQVSSSLEEELALLRGRDDFLSPQVTQSPFYNRLFWNYTRGINSGEALYAVNYNIKEKVGSTSADGSIDAEDAARMFPQGHGDAYGHYLSALKGYYKLLTNPNFTWKPRIEALNIVGNTVAVDYQDERKFAESAAKVAAAAEQVVALTHRQQYHDQPADGWTHFRDGAQGGEFNEARHWGFDEWSSRSGQGAYFHWIVGNAMVPEIDEEHAGIQKIDRTTVLELQRLPVAAESFQTTMDSANAHLNPLGLSPGAIAFDISPSEMAAGNSHYEQIYGRALSAVLNAKGSFDQAGRMTRLLRNQENQIDDFNSAIVDEEYAYTYKLIDLYGTPYPGDVGPGKTYAQGYDGPDLYNWFVVDRPTSWVDTTDPVTIQARVPINTPTFVGFDLTAINASVAKDIAVKTLVVSPNQFIQFADQWQPGIDLGSRSITGRVQQALTGAQLAQMTLMEASDRLADIYEKFDRTSRLLGEQITYQKAIVDANEKSKDVQIGWSLVEAEYRAIAAGFKAYKDYVTETSVNLAGAFPKSNGFSNDVTFAARGTVTSTGGVAGNIATVASLLYSKTADAFKFFKEKEKSELVIRLKELEYGFEAKQLAYEFEIHYQEMVDQYHEVSQLALKLQRAAEEVRTVMALGERAQSDRELFRKRAATIVQGYRTKDLTFRVFRNEALEQYRTLFDLASRYTYLAAKSYDYETGLLGTAQGQQVFNDVVASRALGDLTGDVPQSTVSTLGDSGLAGTMAQMNADFSVAEGRLGINNPDQNGTLFSLRRELFRLPEDPTSTGDDEAWQQTLQQHIVPDVLADAAVASQCRNIAKPDGSPVPGIVITFSTSIEHGKNLFGRDSAAGDHNFSPGNYATKIFSVGVVLPGYVGMDPYAFFGSGGGSPASNDPDALNATPYVYLIPVGVDRMLAPPLGDTNTIRSWKVDDQALPLPYNLGATAFNSTQFFNANGTLSEQPWIIRKHQPFRPVDDPAFFYSLVPEEFTSRRLIGRSVWNTSWKLVIPAYGLLQDPDEQTGLNRFTRSVKDIQLFLRTYSHSGN